MIKYSRKGVYVISDAIMVSMVFLAAFGIIALFSYLSDFENEATNNLPFLIQKYLKLPGQKMQIAKLRHPGCKDVPLIIPADSARYWFLGESGSGKTTLMTSVLDCLLQLDGNHSFCIIERHFSLSKAAINLACCRDKDVYIISTNVRKFPVTPISLYNPENSPEENTLRIIDTLQGQLGIGQYFQLKECLKAGVELLVLGDYPLCFFSEVFENEAFQKKLLNQEGVSRSTKTYFREFARLSKSQKTQRLLPAKNKINTLFDSSEGVKLVLSQPTKISHTVSSLINRPNTMIIVDISYSNSDETASMFGGLIINLIKSAVYSRVADSPENSTLHLFIDEIQNFSVAHSVYSGFLAEGRKFFVNLLCANQHPSQLGERLRKELLINANMLFCLGLPDEKEASVLGKRFGEDTAKKLATLPKHQGYLRDNSFKKDYVEFETVVFDIPDIDADYCGSIPVQEARQNLNKLYNEVDNLKLEKDVKEVVKPKKSISKKETNSEKKVGSSSKEKDVSDSPFKLFSQQLKENKKKKERG